MRLFRNFCLRFTVLILFISILFQPISIQAQQLGSGFQDIPVSSSFFAFEPLNVKGLTLHPDNPLEFDFILNEGSYQQSDAAISNQSMEMIKYFLTTITVPDDQMWVNLSPVEKDRIIADGLGQTLMGKILLEQDYQLKKLTASLLNPDSEIGEKFWNQIHNKHQQDFSELLNKVWIVPGKVKLYRHQDSVFIIQNQLEVLTESDYLSETKNLSSSGLTRGSSLDSRLRGNDSVSKVDSMSTLLNEIVIPAIKQEVNHGEIFAPLRQVYNSMLLATWYKRNLKQSFLGQNYMDRNTVMGVDIEEENMPERVWKNYVELFEDGVADLIREEYDPMMQETVVRKYFTGGTGSYIGMPLPVSYEITKDEASIVNPDLIVKWQGLQEGEDGGYDKASLIVKTDSNSTPFQESEKRLTVLLDQINQYDLDFEKIKKTLTYGNVQFVETLRDAWQNLSEQVKDSLLIETLVQQIKLLYDAGQRHFEIFSHPHPKMSPFMFKVSEELTDRLLQEEWYRNLEGRQNLVFNKKGIELALQRDPSIPKFVLNFSVSAIYARKNYGSDNFLSFVQEKIYPAIEYAQEQGKEIQINISGAFGYAERNEDGEIIQKDELDLDAVVQIIQSIQEKYNLNEFVLSDTTGEADPMIIRQVFAEIQNQSLIENIRLGLHAHDRGLGLVNVLAALESGARIIDSSIGNMGGSFNTKNAVGNVASEDILFLLEFLKHKSNRSLISFLKVVRSFSNDFDEDFGSRQTLGLSKLDKEEWESLLVSLGSNFQISDPASITSVSELEDYMQSYSDFKLSALPEEKKKFFLKALKHFENILTDDVVRLIDENNDNKSKLLRGVLNLIAGQIGGTNIKGVGLAFPEKFGGSEEDTISEVVVTEILATYMQSIALIHDVWNALTAFPLYYGGTEQQKEKYLKALLEGAIVAVFGLTERYHAGSDAIGSMESNFVYDETKNVFVVNAEKHYITRGQSADFMVLFAVFEPDHPQAKDYPKVSRIGALIVPLKDENGDWRKGVVPDENEVLAQKQKVLGHQGTGTTWFSLKNLEVPRENLLGELWIDLETETPRTDLTRNTKTGGNIFLKTLEAGRISISAIGLGSLERSILELKQSMKEKFQKSNYKSDKDQDLLEELMVKSYLSRLLLYHASEMKDNDQEYNFEAGILKYVSTEFGDKIGLEVLQSVGSEAVGNVYHNQNRNVRDNKLNTIGEGSSEIMLYLIFQEIKRKYKKQFNKSREEMRNISFETLLENEFSKITDFEEKYKKQYLQLKQIYQSKKAEIKDLYRQDYETEKNLIEQLEYMMIEYFTVVFSMDLLQKDLSTKDSSFEISKMIESKAQQVLNEIYFSKLNDMKSVGTKIIPGNWNQDENSFFKTGTEVTKDLKVEDRSARLNRLQNEEEMFEGLEEEMYQGPFKHFVQGLAWHDLEFAVQVIEKANELNDIDPLVIENWKRNAFRSAILSHLEQAKEYARQRKSKNGQEIITFVQVQTLIHRVEHLAWFTNADDFYLNTLTAANHLVQIHGGYGYEVDTAVNEFYRLMMRLTTIEMSQKNTENDSVQIVNVDYNRDAFPMYPSFENKVIAVQGIAGAVGSGILLPMLEAGAIIIGADINQEKISEMRRDSALKPYIEEGKLFLFTEKRSDAGYKMDILNPKSEYAEELKTMGIESVDVFLAASSLTGVLDDQTIPELKKAGVKLVVSVANDSTKDIERHTQMLHDNEILFVPETRANYGGLLAVSGFAISDAVFQNFEIDLNDEEHIPLLATRMAQQTIRSLLEKAAAEKISPQRVVFEQNQERFKTWKTMTKKPKNQAEEEKNTFFSGVVSSNSKTHLLKKVNDIGDKEKQMEYKLALMENPLLLDGLEMEDGSRLKVYAYEEDLPDEIKAMNVWDDHYAVIQITNDELNYDAYIAIHRLVQVDGRSDKFRGKFISSGGTRVMNWQNAPFEPFRGAMVFATKMSHKSAALDRLFHIGGSKTFVDVHDINPIPSGPNQDQLEKIYESVALVQHFLTQVWHGGNMTGPDSNFYSPQSEYASSFAPDVYGPHHSPEFSADTVPATQSAYYTAIGEALTILDELKNQKTKIDAAALSNKDTVKSHSITHGGIDLDGTQVDFQTNEDLLSTFEFTWDQAMIQGELTALNPFIISIKRVENPFQILGMNDEESESVDDFAEWIGKYEDEFDQI